MTDETPTNAAPQKRKGFASMPPERLKEIATLGGKSVPAENRAFSRNRELASAAGKKSGRMTRVKEGQTNA